MISLEANLKITPASPSEIFNANMEVRAQLLVETGGCFESRFSGSQIRWNEAYRARAAF